MTKPWDYTRVDTRYIPTASLQKYVYNAAADSKAKQGKLLKTIIPRKEDIQAYQQKITETFAQVNYNQLFVTNYLLETRI